VYARRTVGSRDIVSTDCRWRLHERLPARRESIAPLRRAVVEFADANGVSDRRCEDVALAVSEALSNAVLHAYVGHDGPGLVAVNAWMLERSLEVIVCDEGVGMLPRSDSPGLGLGLSLMARIAERLEVESLEPLPGVRVRMRFAVV